MSHERFDNEDELRRAVIRDLDAGSIPPQVQVKLDGVYASLGSIPQDRPTPSGAGAPQRRQPVKRDPKSSGGLPSLRTASARAPAWRAAVRWWRLRPCSSCC